jgi:hypothetical protein
MSGCPAAASSRRSRGSDAVGEAAAAAAESASVQAIDVMLANLSRYLQGELSLSLDDYHLLQSINKATASRYRLIAGDAAGLPHIFRQLQEKVDALRPHMERVAAIEARVDRIHLAASRLDVATQRIETKYSSSHSDIM